MSDILARLRVRETHGIRRFLYPLYAEVTLPDSTDWPQVSLTTPDRTSLPLQVSEAGEKTRLDFAVSLAPFAEQELHLIKGGVRGVISDPLHITSAEDNCSFQSVQERLEMHIGPDALPHKIVYDGISHLRGPLRVTPMFLDSTVLAEVEGGPLTASAAVLSKTAEQSIYTYSAVTACKSWVTVSHSLSQVVTGGEVVFTLPLAVTSPAMTCDFGVGGGIYAKLQQGTADEVVWHSEFTEEGPVRWSIATNGRVDYVGEAASRKDYLAQQWLHVIDGAKAIAVAITLADPEFWTHIKATLRYTGDIELAFTPEPAERVGTATISVCYHFLNDVPAIAAATNPQSILLPPTVEVLPA